jgi:hypothetical protein
MYRMLKQSDFAGVRLTEREHEGIAANKKQKGRFAAPTSNSYTSISEN